MDILLRSAISTLAIACAAIFMKQKIDYIRYLILFTIILFVNFFFSTLNADDNLFTQNLQLQSEMSYLGIPDAKKEIEIHLSYFEKSNVLPLTNAHFMKAN